MPCCADEEGELKAVVLGNSLLSTKITPDLSFKDIDRKPLQFQTDTRPAKRNLYLHCICHSLQRKKHDVKGWQSDAEKVLTGHIWATPGKWLRSSVLKALAMELGEALEEDEMLNEVAKGLPNDCDEDFNEDVAVRIRGGWEAYTEAELWEDLFMELEDETLEDRASDDDTELC